MPIRLDALDDDEASIPVKPGTNAHELMRVLTRHPDLGFTASELAEVTTVPEGSVGKTLSRLETDGLVRNVDGYWAVAEDVDAASVSNLVRLAELDDLSGGDTRAESEVPSDDVPSGDG